MMNFTPWHITKAKMTAHMTPEEYARWDKALDRARARYTSEIRKYRGIPRLREMYRRRNR